MNARQRRSFRYSIRPLEELNGKTLKEIAEIQVKDENEWPIISRMLPRKPKETPDSHRETV
jgi:hypothetical protein